VTECHLAEADIVLRGVSMSSQCKQTWHISTSEQPPPPPPEAPAGVPLLEAPESVTLEAPPGRALLAAIVPQLPLAEAAPVKSPSALPSSSSCSSKAQRVRVVSRRSTLDSVRALMDFVASLSLRNTTIRLR